MQSSHSSSSFAQRRSQAYALAASLPHVLWRGDALGRHAAPSIPTGHARLNSELPGGGWPPSVLTELLWAQHGGGEFRLLAPVLNALTQAGKTIILLAPPHLVFAPALVQLGIDLKQVLIVQAQKPADRLWAVEQVLKSASFGALLCWLPQARAEHLRRLQLVANSSEGLVFVFRPASAQLESSPAPLRLLCRADSEGQIAVEVIKRRGPVASSPIILPAQLPPVIARALGKSRFPNILPAGCENVLDRPLPAATAAGSRVPSLA